jgi:hypothetical protein
VSPSTSLVAFGPALPDFAAISARLEDLLNVQRSRRYEGQKCQSWRTFGAFLACYDPPLDVDLCDALHVVEFLVHQDSGGRTVVHIFGCALFGYKIRRVFVPGEPRGVP